MLVRSSSSLCIYELTKKELKLGPGNKPGDSKPDLYITNMYAREIFDFLKNSNLYKNSFPEDPFKQHILMLMLRAILAEAFQTGFCGEFSVTTFINALKGALNHVEIIRFAGTTHENKRDDHWVVIRYRDPNSDLNDPTTWGHFIMIDTWLGVPPIEYQTSKNVKLSDLCPYLKEVHSISCIISYNEKIPNKDWAQFITPLELLRDYLPAFYANSLGGMFNVLPMMAFYLQLYSNEMCLIHDKFNQHIKMITDLSLTEEKEIKRIDHPYACNVVGSFCLQILDDKQIVQFSIFPGSKGPTELDNLRNVLGLDPKTNNNIIQKKNHTYRMRKQWLQELNEFDPDAISYICRLLQFNEGFFRKRLHLENKSEEIVVDQSKKRKIIAMDP